MGPLYASVEYKVRYALNDLDLYFWYLLTLHFTRVPFLNFILRFEKTENFSSVEAQIFQFKHRLPMKKKNLRSFLFPLEIELFIFYTTRARISRLLMQNIQLKLKTVGRWEEKCCVNGLLTVDDQYKVLETETIHIKKKDRVVRYLIKYKTITACGMRKLKTFCFRVRDVMRSTTRVCVAEDEKWFCIGEWIYEWK